MYTPAEGFAGEDEFTYEVTVKGKGPADGSAVVRITVSEPTPSPTPTPTPTVAPSPKAKPKAAKPAEPSVYYENCDAARAAGAAPVRRGDPGYAAHLDRDDDGVGCEPYGSSSGGSGGGSSSGGVHERGLHRRGRQRLVRQLHRRTRRRGRPHPPRRPGIRIPPRP